MRTIKLITVFLLLIWQFGNFNVSASTTTSVDSMFQVIKGTWYFTESCSGMTGNCDTVYSSVQNEISLVPGSDSVYWKTYADNTLTSTKTYLLSKRQSLILNKQVWCLSQKSGQLLIPFIIDSDGSNLSLSLDAYDGSSQLYSRVMNEKAPSQASIDSVTQCLAGDWYKVYSCQGISGLCDSVYSEMKYIFTPIAGTDSIIYTGTTLNSSQTGVSFVKYRLIRTANNISNSKSWMLQGAEGERIFVSCSNGFYSLNPEGYDTPWDLFSRTPRFATPESLAIDSLAACLAGSWFKVQENNDLNTQSKLFYSKNENSFFHTLGSSYINWKKRNGDVITDIKYRVEPNKDAFVTGYRWKLIPYFPLPDCANISSDFVINCQSDTLKIQNKNIDLTTTTSIYARHSRVYPNRQATIDSIASLLTGDWYEYQVCHRISDVCDSVYSNLKYTFTHKQGTDTLIWTGEAKNTNLYRYSTYKIVEDEDYNGNLIWKLLEEFNNENVDSIFVLPHLVKHYYRFDYSADYFGIQEMLPQSRYTTYTRSPRIVTSSVMKIDSVANCLEGEWYLKTESPHHKNQDKKIIITHEEGVAGILATCYIDDSISGHWDYGVEVQPENLNQVILHFAIYPKPICGMTVTGFIDYKYVAECNDSTFKITELEFPTNYQIYSRENPNNGTGIKEVETNDLGFSISPNPIKTKAHINGESPIERIKLISLQGITVLENVGDIHSLDLSSFSSGIYFLQINSQGKTQNLKLIKE